MIALTRNDQSDGLLKHSQKTISTCYWWEELQGFWRPDLFSLITWMQNDSDYPTHTLAHSSSPPLTAVVQ